MAGSVNKVFLMGNLTRDVELKYTPSNQPVATFGIAMNRRYKTKDGENREETTFVDCEAWARTAEVMSEYLSKGRPVFIEGRLKLDQWQDKDGNNRSRLSVVVQNFTFVDSRGSAGGGSGGGGGGSRASAPEPVASANRPSAASPDSGQHQPVSEDDIPF